jgi:hypothetical protein
MATDRRGPLYAELCAKDVGIEQFGIESCRPPCFRLHSECARSVGVARDVKRALVLELARYAKRARNVLQPLDGHGRTAPDAPGLLAPDTSAEFEQRHVDLVLDHGRARKAAAGDRLATIDDEDGALPVAQRMRGQRAADAGPDDDDVVVRPARALAGDNGDARRGRPERRCVTQAALTREVFSGRVLSDHGTQLSEESQCAQYSGPDLVPRGPSRKTKS